MRFGDREYGLTRASDVARDGMALEVEDRTDGGRELLLEVFYSDADGSMRLTAWRADLPLDLVEWAIAEARRLLPPIDQAT